jgi:hypothetical protein
MKNVAKTAAALLGICLLTGCADNTEISSGAVIQAVSVDFEDGEYLVSLLMFSGGSGGEIDTSLDNSMRVSGSGKSLSEAIQSISLDVGRELFMSETKLLVLGGGFEEQELTNTINTLCFDMRCSLNLPVCCAERAGELLELRFTEGITAAEKPLAMLENARSEGVSPKTVLLDILSDSAAGRASLVPEFAVVEGAGFTSDESGKTAVLCGSRYISDGKLSSAIDSETTAGLMLLTGLSSKTNLNYVHNGAERSCEAYGVKAENVGNGDIKVTAKFRRKNGSSLPEDERETALAELSELVSAGMKYGNCP